MTNTQCWLSSVHSIDRRYWTILWWRLNEVLLFYILYLEEMNKNTLNQCCYHITLEMIVSLVSVCYRTGCELSGYFILWFEDSPVAWWIEMKHNHTMSLNAPVVSLAFSNAWSFIFFIYYYYLHNIVPHAFLHTVAYTLKLKATPCSGTIFVQLFSALRSVITSVGRPGMVVTWESYNSTMSTY